MRNYIILNNQNSNTISGLIIQELAPISKPLQRTQVETIDGRDGDIVTPLGYAAYDKKITIGLYGNFDINEIIAYFATQGTVIFSNEPDKYYNYQILDQIDYERLVRFRVATVTMHVQPFKYSATEGTLTIDASDTVSGEGSEIALDNTAEAPFNTLRHKGNAIQDGTPTPDNPIDVKVLTGDSTVKITGKNLLDFDDFLTIAGATYTKSADKYNIAAVGSLVPTRYELNVIAGETYTISCEKATQPTSNPRMHIFKNGTHVGSCFFGGEQQSASYSFTAESGSVYAINLTYSSPFNSPIIVSKPQLETGDQATTYEPYKEQSYVIPFGDTYLAGIGNYADEPVKVGDTWYIRRAIGKVVFDGSESGWYYQDSGTLTNRFAIPVSSYGLASGAQGLCSNNEFVTSGVSVDSQRVGIVNSVLYYRINKTTLASTSADDFKTWIASNNTIIYTALATPTDEEITDQDLIDALDEFYGQAHSYKGHTHIAATAEDGNAPAILSVEVGEDNESTVTNAGNTTSRPILTIYGQGDIGVYINDVEVLDIALGNEQYITLDSTEMDAYKDSPANLKNRLVTGDYSKLALNAGANKIRFTGTVTKYEISKYSRWL